MSDCIENPEETMKKLGRIVTRLENDAEDANFHGTIGVYQTVADIVTKHAGAGIALKVMIDIRKRGGFIP